MFEIGVIIIMDSRKKHVCDKAHSTLSKTSQSDYLFLFCHQELPGGYGRVKPDVVTYGSGVRGSSLKYVLI